MWFYISVAAACRFLLFGCWGDWQWSPNICKEKKSNGKENANKYQAFKSEIHPPYQRILLQLVVERYSVRKLGSSEFSAVSTFAPFTCVICLFQSVFFISIFSQNILGWFEFSGVSTFAPLTWCQAACQSLVNQLTFQGDHHGQGGRRGWNVIKSFKASKLRKFKTLPWRSYANIHCCWKHFWGAIGNVWCCLGVWQQYLLLPESIFWAASIGNGGNCRIAWQ